MCKNTKAWIPIRLGCSVLARFQYSNLYLVKANRLLIWIQPILYSHLIFIKSGANWTTFTNETVGKHILTHLMSLALGVNNTFYIMSVPPLLYFIYGYATLLPKMVIFLVVVHFSSGTHRLSPVVNIWHIALVWSHKPNISWVREIFFKTIHVP